MKTIYDLDLHETMMVDESGCDGTNTVWKVTRVASGWIYIDYNPRLTSERSFFVPFDNKFETAVCNPK